MYCKAVVDGDCRGCAGDTNPMMCQPGDLTDVIQEFKDLKVRRHEIYQRLSAVGFSEGESMSIFHKLLAPMPAQERSDYLFVLGC